MQDEHGKGEHNGRRLGAEHVEVEDTIVVETRSADAAQALPDQQEFEVVGIVEDADSSRRYAVCYNEGADEFIVTDDVGRLLSDDDLAQEVLDDFLHQAVDSQEDGA